jgi:iron complex transport system substrate-binding protein
MRVASLLPSATEIVCAVGATDALVGRSHECDFPPGVDDVPILTSAKVLPRGTSGAIDAAVRDVVREGLAVYDIDVEALRAADPDLIVTQDLCDVCAVSFDDVCAAVRRLVRPDTKVVSLHPKRLADIWADIVHVGEALGRTDAARALVDGFEERARDIGRRSAALTRRPTVLTIEWIDPVMIGGMWMPELVELAGGEPLVTRAGDHAPTLDKAALAALDPEVVLVKPCGFDIPRTLEEADALGATLPRGWRAVRNGRVYITDGSAYFNRPGPRIVESLEILAACAHPDAFPDLAAKHARSIVRGTDTLGGAS